jgi:hypothetical protein
MNPVLVIEEPLLERTPVIPSLKMLRAFSSG